MQSSQSTRFTPQAAEQMRQSIQKAGGVEIFAIGKMDTNGLVSSIEVHCRGNKHAVAKKTANATVNLKNKP